MNVKQSTAGWLVAIALCGATVAVGAQQPSPSPDPADPSKVASDPAVDAAPEATPDPAVDATPPAADTAPPPAAPAATTDPVAALRSELMPNAATQALILDIAESDSRAIAVGERGQILVSESRSDWRQVADVPTRATLTAVAAGGKTAWAVGHDGVILHSADGGLAWTVQRIDVQRPPADDEEFDPRQGVPLLDVLMLDAQRAIAVGAYSLMLRTDDGGATWRRVDVTGAVADAAPDAADADADADTDTDTDTDEGDAYDEESWTISSDELVLDEESDPHFNGIVRTGSGALFIVAERGAAFRSRDDGATWERLQLPYPGSMFGAIAYEGDHLIAFGMRGNAFETRDLGDTWNTLDTGTDLSLMGGAPLPGGGVVLVGANGIVVHRASADAAPATQVYSTEASGTPVLASVLPRGGADLIVSGEKGLGTTRLTQQ
ncbi:WD40/YVTN/BNR-like repeat-containing protein [Chiayiivirga flava]|uniref:Photosystem II stability/assembly factor-like uncharacterized protein n=1 Tax=Chiayiivirga flava TaxID=659595 RepID=A0A7W8D7A5_9GAMM|nr:YCF48-related protein [Chiayiivirga flava]MBB5207588.1 photosystem II stability/assembly factor-like uncharacterized protein [Chiayiivirga flava]